jgi:hypothetical protein
MMILTYKVKKSPKKGSPLLKAHAKRKRHPANLARRPWDKLSPTGKMLRVRALSVLRQMRVGMTLTNACRYVGMSPRSAKKQIKGAIRKNHRWHSFRTDKIQRGMLIYSAGQIKTVVIDDSRTASLLSDYFNNMKYVFTAW